jgi:hypothetical protein
MVSAGTTSVSENLWGLRRVAELVEDVIEEPQGVEADRLGAPGHREQVGPAGGATCRPGLEGRQH